MSVIFSRAPLRDLARRRRHRPALLLPRARRLPRVGGDRQVRLHAHPHGLPAPLPDEVLRARGGRRDQPDPPPDPARDAAAPLARQPAGDRLGGRRAGGHRHGLLGRLHRLPAQGPGAARGTARSPRAIWPRRRARSRSTCSASRSASRTPTSPPTAGSAPTRSTRTAPSRSSRSSSTPTCCGGCATSCCCSTPARRARPRRCWPTRTRAPRPATQADAREPAPHQGARAAQIQRAARAGELEAYAELMHEHWEHKRRRSPGMTNEHIDRLYDARPAQRRDRRQARRRRRRRLPARLRPPARGHQAGDGGRAGASELAFDFEFGGAYAERVRMSGRCAWRSSAAG